MKTELLQIIDKAMIPLLTYLVGIGVGWFVRSEVARCARQKDE